VTDTERQRLAHILGMLGSDSVGERAAAALQAEAFRKRHGMTWAEMMSGETVYVDRPVYVDRAVPPYPPPPQPYPPPPPAPQPWASLQGFLRNSLPPFVLGVAPFVIIYGLAYWFR
jgi:hypothetical protein